MTTQIIMNICADSVRFIKCLSPLFTSGISTAVSSAVVCSAHLFFFVLNGRTRLHILFLCHRQYNIEWCSRILFYQLSN